MANCPSLRSPGCLLDKGGAVRAGAGAFGQATDELTTEQAGQRAAATVTAALNAAAA